MNSKPQVILYRGLPGCGKTYSIQQWMLSLKLHPNDPAPRVFSADFFFQKNGKYEFDYRKIGEAHAWCYRQFLDMIIPFDDEIGENISHLVIDNTNICAFEMAPYIQAANAYGLVHEIRTIWSDPVVAAKRNVHNVPATTIFRMYTTLLNEQLPPFWNHKLILPTEN